MKKNNKFRSNNYNNQIFSLNYKFDSLSAAGKISGTALDLIKKYNELAKEAQGNADYVGAEVFRQYAEHYRKIVTEINERKNQQQSRQIKGNTVAQGSEENLNDSQEETLPTTPSLVVEQEVVESSVPVKREFKVIEISSTEAQTEIINNVSAEKPRAGRPRGSRRKAEVATAL